ncbi:MAG TPA: type I methionyl aminopeptidase [Thermoanaerobaculia bacterium]|nr:type I methionyl aminopeptidase [Thermoanaerobaculia bacterium]
MILLKTPGELELLDQANRLVHEVLELMAEWVAPGVTTRELDRLAEEHIRRAGGVPAFLGYRGFPATLCTSVNDEIIHGIPNDCPLREGDIVGIDCGVMYKGYFGDAARTFAVGEVSPGARALLEVTRECLERAVEQVRPGGRLSDIGHAVQTHAEEHGFEVVREFVGHGVGTALHEEPNVPNYGKPGRGPRLKSGMVLAIEPMINAGSRGVTMDPDGWTARTEDGSLSAHFEYSVAVVPSGARVLGVGAEQQAAANA